MLTPRNAIEHIVNNNIDYISIGGWRAYGSKNVGGSKQEKLVLGHCG